MEFRRFGPTKFQVPVIGQGTWHLERDDHAAAIAALRLGIDLGMRHIDTAELYGWGVVERIVGEAIAGRREEVFLVSKVVPANASYSGTLAACQTSLSRLRTEWLDCYLLHWRGDYPLSETFDAFEQLQRDGKIRCWGVSNFDEADLEEARRIAGDGHLACDQVLYHLQERAIEHAVLPWCERHNTAVMGYAPFGHGRLPSPRTEGGRVLQAIADAHGATARQVALRFLVRRPSLFTIAKASNPEHVAENAAAAHLRLSEQEIEMIARALPPSALRHRRAVDPAA